MNQVITERPVESRVKAVFSRELGFRVDQINITDKLCEDLGMDSLDFAEVALALEEEFGLERVDLSAASTVADTINVIDELTPVPDI
ncbi:MAG TPA: phosphopantetheine-binding protein [Pyrinomonadaceae bacterium]|jgi:acyl carrier protein|nr:phosphopantetheine-binding protein [Pyrinomonadaceae bacterium]